MENQNESQNNKKKIEFNNHNINDIHQSVKNALTYQFLIASLTNSVLMNMTNSRPFHVPSLNSKSNMPGPYESYKTFLISKNRLEMKKNHLDNYDDDIQILSVNESEKEDVKKMK